MTPEMPVFEEIGRGVRVRAVVNKAYMRLVKLQAGSAMPLP
jgi:hypothetical protein